MGAVNTTVLAQYSAWKKELEKATDPTAKQVAQANLHALDISDDGKANGSIAAEIDGPPPGSSLLSRTYNSVTYPSSPSSDSEKAPENESEKTPENESEKTPENESEKTPEDESEKTPEDASDSNIPQGQHINGKWIPADTGELKNNHSQYIKFSTVEIINQTRFANVDNMLSDAPEVANELFTRFDVDKSGYLDEKELSGMDMYLHSRAETGKGYDSKRWYDKNDSWNASGGGKPNEELVQFCINNPDKRIDIDDPKNWTLG